MSGSTRRSDRATKGQHNSRSLSEDVSDRKSISKPVAKANAKAKVAAKSKPTKTSRASKAAEEEEEEGDEDEDDGGVVRCICGKENVGKGVDEACIACEGPCQTWQHNVCMGITTDEKEAEAIKNYNCEQCKPEDHQETVEALANGIKIWEERQRPGSRRKSGRPAKAASSRRQSVAAIKEPETKSKPEPGPEREPEPKPEVEPIPELETETTINDTTAHEPSAVESTTIEEQPPTKATGNKRRRVEDSPQIQKPIARSPAVTQDGRRASSGRADKRRKQSAVPETDDVVASIVSSGPVPFEKLSKQRQGPVSGLIKLISEGIARHVDAGNIVLGPDETLESFSSRLGSQIEHEIFIAHGLGTSSTAYSDQIRQVLPNLKSNVVLLDQVLHGNVTPAKLAVMSSQEMASEELQKVDAQIREQNDKQAIMQRPDDDKPQLVKTSTGLEYITSNSNRDHEAVPIEAAKSPVADGPGQDENTARGKRTPDGDRRASIMSPGERLKSESEHGEEDIAPMEASKVPAETRRPSQQQQPAKVFDMNTVWAKTQQVPMVDQSSAQKGPRPAPSQTPAPPAQRVEDADVDRLLADPEGEEDKDELYASGDANNTFKQPIIWQGRLLQPGVTEVMTDARYVAGSDFSAFMPWQDFLPRMLEIEGRLLKASADEYLSGLEWSRKADLTMLAITPHNREGEQRFDQIFDYFAERGRYAVGKRAHGICDYVRDLYLTPVEANADPPPFVERLSFCDIVFPCPKRVLLAAFVINKPIAWAQSQDHAIPSTEPPVFPEVGHHQPGRQSLPGPIASPIGPGGYAQSPFPPAEATMAYGESDRTGHGSTLPYSQPDILTNARVDHFLGPHVNTSTAQTVLRASTLDVEDFFLINMRNAFDRNPASRYDMRVFAKEVELTD